MPTKLSRYCDGILEITWLVAIIVVPVFFNIYSSRIFEPDKLTLLRSLTLIMLAIWVIKLLEQGASQKESHITSEWFKSIIKVPLIIPVLATAIVYVIATIFSVSPATSLWGSYQRLQGTYTTFSYFIIFLVIIGNLRQRSQAERLITTIIVASLPVSLYGVLQRYKIDPIPWGGDVAIRIASNMGNSIFVAAYLIMVFPITMGRIVESFRAILNETGFIISDFARATAYVFIGALQVISLYFTGSRGPTLGWLVGCFILAIILALSWRKRAYVVGIILVAILILSFLMVLNIQGGPLEGLRNSEAIGRFSQLLDPQSNNARVRTYIWQGAAKLVAPHKPLQYPDGRMDLYNPIRPLIGYGPESMYVAYNPFYPPDLTLVEKRNASPDRSHNETWDSLVITGIAGLFVYLLLFGSVLYYGLKWLGMIQNSKQRNLFLVLFLGCGLVVGVGFILWRGVPYLGAGLPFGMVLGLVLYFTYIVLSGNYQSPRTETEWKRNLIIAVLLAAIISHFIEINFGIAIAVTRTYFWVYSALLLIFGHILPSYEILEINHPEEDNIIAARKDPKDKNNIPSKKKRRSTRIASRRKTQPVPNWLLEACVSCIVVAVILMSLGYEFVSAAQGGNSGFEIIWNSLVKLKNVYSGISYGVLAMFMTSWLVGGIVITSENENTNTPITWLKQLGVILVGALILSLIYWILHANTLFGLITKQPTNLAEILDQVRRYENILTNYYSYIGFLILIGALSIYFKTTGSLRGITWQGILASCLSIALVPYLILITNIRVVQGDIAFKLAEPFNKENSWPVAIEIYKHAIEISPTEDYYYLFLGRAYLEYAKTLDKPADREGLISQAESDLKKAQQINPLNTDHTANLARLYSLWSAFSDDPKTQKERADISSNYFKWAITLSPNNSRLWDEWALLYLNTLSQPEEAYQRLSHSAEIDPYYDWTQALLGEYYVKKAESISDPSSKREVINQAIFYYGEAKRLTGDKILQANYTLAQAQLAINSQQFQIAISALNEVISLTPTSSEIWKYEQTLAQLYAQINDKSNALNQATMALNAAPQDQKKTIESLITQLQAMP